jgi:GntR family transcriptional regulator
LTESRSGPRLTSGDLQTFFLAVFNLLRRLLDPAKLTYCHSLVVQYGASVKIDPRSHVPIYLQIADEIRATVAAGVYCPGDALPSLRAMAVETQVNPNTVQRAYDELEREGLIYSQRGKGLFVTERGTASAQAGAENGVRQIFDSAVRASLAAGMSARQIRAIFSAALEDSRRAPADRPPVAPNKARAGSNRS